MTMRCEAARLLAQAELDNELDAGRAAELAVHIDACPDCARLRHEMAGLSRRLRALPRHAAPERLRALVALPRGLPWWRRGEVGFGAGFALAASLALFLVPTRGDDLAASLVAGHVRALQADHLLDVASSDQHQVKPWFLGRLDYAPPVKELADFPLLGGRLDYLAGQPVAALVYRAAGHSINLFVLREDGAGLAPPTQRQGFNLRHWRDQGLAYWAVSDLNPEALAGFEAAWRAAP